MRSCVLSASAVLGLLAIPIAGQQPPEPLDARLIPSDFREAFRHESDYARIWSMVFAPTGHLIVVDSDAFAVTVFDVAGRVTARWGRKGEGPGEFEWPPGKIAVSREGLVALDTNSGRIDLVDLGGNFVDSRPLGGLSIGGLMFDPQGRLLVEEGSPVEAEPTRILRFDDDEVLWSSRPYEPATSLAFAKSITLFPHKVVMAEIGAGELVVGETDSYELAVLDASTGRELGRIDRDVAIRGPSDDFLARFKERLGPAAERVRFPELFPAIGAVFVGPPGRTVWVRRDRGVADALAPALVDLVDSTGQLYDLFASGDSYDYIGTVQIPERLELMAGDSTRVAGVYTGALGEESVRVLRVSLRIP